MTIKPEVKKLTDTFQYGRIVNLHLAARQVEQAKLKRLPMRDRSHIEFSEIANAIAKERPEPETQRLSCEKTFGQLADDICNCFFERDGVSVVIVSSQIGIENISAVMSRENFLDAQSYFAEDAVMKAGFYAQLQVPREYALRWFIAHDERLPVGWFLEAEVAALKHLPSSRAETVTDRPKPSNVAVRRWQQDRVRTWPADLSPPSEKVDWAAVRAAFGDGMNRDDYRRIREAETPFEWRKQGPRQSKASIAKSANKSAKSRTQI